MSAGIDIKYTIFAGGEVLSFSCKLENYMDRNAEKQEDFIDTAALLWDTGLYSFDYYIE